MAKTIIAQGKVRKSYTISEDMANKLAELAFTFKTTPSNLLDLILRCSLDTASAEDSFTNFMTGILSNAVSFDKK